MPDELTYKGLSTKPNSELLEEIQQALRDIYSPNGEEIDFSSASPDGQFSQLLATIGTVHRELLTSVYNATDPTKCDGAQQDSKYQINYLIRKGGSYTTQNIAVTTTKTVTLQGLDGSYNDNTSTAFTVSDDSGNLWYLEDSITIFAGTTQLVFRAQEQGAVTPTIGTINKMVTIVDGVKSVNNIVGYTSLGVDQESNYEFRIRRDRSTENISGNNADSIVGKILKLNGVKNCVVWVNDTDTTDATGTSPHYLWVIADGGANTEIADVIYSEKGGCGTRGNVTVPINTISAQTLDIKFDRPNIVPLYIKFDLFVYGDLTSISIPAIKEYIAENLLYEISENAETSKITAICAEAITAQNGGAYALNVEISTGGSATASVSGSGVTSAVVDVVIFQSVMGDISTGNYVFTFTTNGWTYNGDLVNISNYGIIYTGTPANNDTITIAYTQGAFVDYIEAPTLAAKFTADTNKIYITVTEE